MSQPAKETFGRDYLLKVYNAALEHGYVRLTPIAEASARSFTQQFYRLRRRTDASHAHFITPEMHLVTVGSWLPENNGTLVVYYNARPAEEPPLPEIIPGRPLLEELTEDFPRPMTGISTAPPENTEDLNPFDTEDFVEGLRRKAHKDD